MADDRRRKDARPGDPAEGVRIIGAEEAAEAIERGDVASRRGDNLPRYGDRPARPPVGSPKPALRFPLDASADPAEAASVRPAKGVRFDPRPDPAWDEAPVDDQPAGDPWPAEGTWDEASEWSEGDKEDVAAWTRGETSATPVVADAPPAVEEPAEEQTGHAAEAASEWAPAGTEAASAEPAGALAWADDFVDDDDPWDGSWDEPTGAVRWADDAAPAGGEAATAGAEASPPPADDDVVVAPGEDPAGPLLFDDEPSAEVPVAPATSEDEGEGEERPALFTSDGGWADAPAPVFDFGDDPSGQVELPHWTEPGTGELPRVLADETPDAGPATGSVPVWQGHDGGWGASGFDDLTEGDDVRLGALDDERPHHDDIYAFDEVSEEEPAAAPPLLGGRREPPPRPRPEGGDEGGGAGRNIGVAAAVGVGAAALALFAFALGPAYAMILVIAILGLGVVEYQNAVRRAGYRPAALLGIVATVCYPLAVYWRGIEAYPLLAVLTVAAALAWHLVGADGDARVVESVGVTVLGVAWVGGLGSFAALMLSLPDGTGMLTTAVIAAVAYDVGGLAIGRTMGTRPVSDASPNKTVEGLVGGIFCALFAMLLVGLFGLAPFDGPGAALGVGVLAALAAPLGDLCESLVKRDLGVKDMGSLLPEHGGILDRFDALLFVLPAVFYGALFFEIGPFG